MNLNFSLLAGFLIASCLLLRRLGLSHDCCRSESLSSYRSSAPIGDFAREYTPKFSQSGFESLSKCVEHFEAVIRLWLLTGCLEQEPQSAKPCKVIFNTFSLQFRRSLSTYKITEVYPLALLRRGQYNQDCVYLVFSH